MQFRWTQLLPALALAGGILAGTAVTRAAPHLGFSVLAGPFVLAAAILLVGELVRRQPEAPRGMRTASVILALATLAASVFVAGSDPARVVEVLPLLGAGAVVLVLGDGGQSTRCRRRRAERAETAG